MRKLRKKIDVFFEKEHKVKFVLNYLLCCFYKDRTSIFWDVIVLRLLRFRFFDELAPIFLIRSYGKREVSAIAIHFDRLILRKNKSLFDYAYVLVCSLFFSQHQLSNVEQAQGLERFKGDLFLLTNVIFFILLETRNKALSQDFQARKIGDFRKAILSAGLSNHAMIVTEDLLPKEAESEFFRFFDPQIFEGEQTRVERIVPISHSAHFEAKQVRVVQGNQLIDFKTGSRIVLDDVSSAKNGLVAGCWTNFVEIGADRGKSVDLFFDRSSTKTTLNGLTFLLSGRASGNYFHWMVEDLPRLSLLEDDPGLRSSIESILVDEAMPEQHFQSLALMLTSLNISAKRIRKRKNDESVSVSHLISKPIHTLHPDRFDRPFWEGGALDPKALNFLRSHFFPYVTGSQSKYPKRFYVSRRRSGARSILNGEQVESAIRMAGFEVVYPERLTFEDQLNLFFHATHIIAQSGAALTNLLFCGSTPKVIAITSERNQDYPMYSNIAKVSDCKFTHLIGRSEYPRNYYSNEDMYVHSNYKIDVDVLSRALKTMY